MPCRRPVSWVMWKRLCRNGRELRDLLPLWNEGGLTMPRRRPVSGVREEMPYRNGRELRDLVPLWKDALWKGGLGEGEAGGKGED